MRPFRLAGPLVVGIGGGAGGSPISAAVLYSGIITPSGSNLVTSSISPGSNRLLVAVMAARFSGAPADDIIAVTGNGLTWDRITERQTATTNRMLGVFRSMGASPSAGAVTFAESDAGSYSGNAVAAVLEFSNVDTSGTNGSGAVDASSISDNIAGSDTTISVTIGSTPGASDVCFAVMMTLNDATSLTSDSNYDTLTTAGPSDEVQLRADWDAGNDQSVTWTWTVSVPSAAAGFIINAP